MVGDRQGPAAQYLARLVAALSRLDAERLDAAVDLIRAAWRDGRQIFTFGNGGSALTAQHYVTDWNKMIYLATGRPFRGRCLSENVGLLSAYANDLSFADCFAAPLQAMLEPSDVVIGISGSGNSENVLRAIRYANDHGGTTLGVCGHHGGKLKELARHYVCPEIDDMQISEDFHRAFGHIVMQTLCGMIP